MLSGTAADAGVGTCLTPSGQAALDQAATIHPTVTKDLGRCRIQGQTVEHGATLGIDVEVVTKDPQVKGFSVLKRRWVAEHATGRLMQHRRLTRDYEALPGNSTSMITIAMIDNLARRLTGETTPTWHDPQTEQHRKMR